jgi:hypothetical protein
MFIDILFSFFFKFIGNCCGDAECSIFFSGGKDLKDAQIENWLRNITKIPFTHIIKEQKNK